MEIAPTLRGESQQKLAAGAPHDTIDVVVRVTNEGSAPLEDLRYVGGGPVLHPEYVPDALRGSVRGAPAR